jgi:uncharacterized protein
MNKGYFKIFIGIDGQFYFDLNADNHEIILQSEGYKRKSGCMNGIASVRKHSQIDECFHRDTQIDKQPFFTLKAKNGEKIGKGEGYTSRAMMENGIASVKENAKTASIKDETKDKDKGRLYKFKVDGKNLETEKECLTGREVLQMAGLLPPENYLLRQLFQGNEKKPIDLDEFVCLTDPGIERFVTIPKDPTDGCHEK